MRWFLTSCAVVLIVVLTAALLAPWFVDATQWRTQIEAELTARIGARVTTQGQIDFRLLPTPVLELGALQIGDQFSADSARFELALAPLAGGELRFAEIDLESPRATLALDDHGALSLPRGGLSALLERAAVERLVVRGGRASLARGASAPIVVENADFDASAGSLSGPYRGAGAGQLAGLPRFNFEFVSGQIADDALPIKLVVNSASSSANAAFDGRLALEASGGGWRPRYAGAATLSGALAAVDAAGSPAPWKAQGQLALTPDAARFDNLALSLGPETRALQATGVGVATFLGEPTIDLDLTAKELNVDALLRGEKEESAPPARAAAALAEVASELSGVGAPTFRGSLKFATPSLYLGAATLDDVALQAKAEPGKPLSTVFSAGLPGQGRINLDGAFDLGVAPKFEGRAQMDVGDIGALGDWAATGAPWLTARAHALSEALPYSQMSASGHLLMSKVTMSLTDLALSLDKSKFTGAVFFTAPQPSARGRLYLDLSTPSLDLDEAPDLTSGAFWVGDFDLEMRLSAARLHIAHAGQSAVESGSLALHLLRTADKLTLDKLKITDLNGASVDAEAEFAPNRQWGRAKLDAARLADFAGLVARVAPGKASRLFAARAEALSPAHATLEARREGEAKSSGFPFDFLKADGEAGGVKFALTVNDAPSPVSALGVALTLDAAEGGALMKSFGVKAPSSSIGRAHVALNASGRYADGFAGEVKASFAGAEISASGRYTPDVAAPSDAALFGSANVKADNILPLLAAFKFANAAPGVVAPVDLAADLVWRGDSVAAPKIAGSVAGAKLTGALTWTSPPTSLDLSILTPDLAQAQALAGDSPPSGGIVGNLMVDRATLGAVLSTAFGPLAAAKPPLRWSEAKFAEPLAIPPIGDLKIKFDDLDLGPLGASRNVTAQLKTDAGKFDLSDVSLDAGAAHLTGHAMLRRDGATAALSGGVTIDPITLDTAAARGKLGLTLDFATTGQSPAAVVAGLVGDGELRLQGVTLPNLDAQALERVLAKDQAPEALIDETNVQHALQAELDRRPLALNDQNAPLFLSSGVFRVASLGVSGATPPPSVAATYDVKTGDASIDATFQSTNVGKFWSAAPPTLSIVITGSPDAPQRRIDDSNLVAGLASQAIAREADRVAALEADLRERAYFNRRMKAEAFMEQSRREEAAYEAEQLRLKYDAERRRVEDSLVKAAEDKQRAAAQPPAPPPDGKSAPALIDPTSGGIY